MSHGIATLIMDALRAADYIPMQQQQAVHAACAAGQLHLRDYNHAQLAAAEAARAGHPIRAHKASNQSLIAFRVQT